MMRCSLRVLATAAVVVVGRFLHADEPDRVPASVRVDVQMVSISIPEAEQLVPALRDRKTAEAAWTRLQQMIAQDEAKLLAWPVLWLQSSIFGWVDSSTESVEEVRYATEFTPPDSPSIFGRPPRISPTWGPSVPTAFETRNVGATIEAHVAVAPGGKAVKLDLSSQFVRLEGFRVWHVQRSPLGIAGVQQQPIFQKAEIYSHLHVQQGQPMLVGVFVFSQPEPHVELHILHARVKLLPPSAVTPPPP